MKTEDLVNFGLALDMLDSLLARADTVRKGMAAAIAEDRDLTENEVMGFKAQADEEDAKLRDEIEARRQREVLGHDQPSDKITGETGGDIRP